MSNNSLYKFILPVAMISLSLSSCSDSEEYTVSGDGTLSPLSISVNLSDGSAKTRAKDKEFESADKLLAYIEHVDANSQTVNVDMSPSLVTLDVNADPVHKDITNGKETSSLTVSSIKQGSSELLPTGQTVLYWDDFSSSSNDINTTGHGLRVKYGYCLNGRVLDPAPTLGGDGIMTWSVIQNQRTAEKADYKKSDLLWSKTQESVAYSHSTDRAGLKIPYTHAMSKVTLVLIANEGFATTAFTNTEATLLNMNITGTMRATDATITTASAGTGDDAGKVFMYKNTPATTIIEEKTLPICTFEALVMPTKKLTNGLVIASLTDVEGNNYNITISDEILKGFNKNVDPEKPDDNTAPVIMKSGVNYKLTITLDKQPQTIVAQITDWNNVEATATGEIKFAYDVVSHNITEGTWTNGDQLDLWRLGYQSATQNKDNEAYGDKATTSTFNGTEWENDPQIYWANGSQKYYFRALSKYEAKSESDATKVYKSVDGSTSVAQGTDLIWATTAAHIGTEADGTTTHDYAAGAAIDPRTGTVPMAFEHAMSKITVNLETSKPTTVGDPTPVDAVAWAGATISIANIYHAGTIALEDGTITPSDPTIDIPISGLLAANDATSGNKLSEYVVVPQSLNMMADGTTERKGNVAFYNVGELTKIGDDYYVTSTLDKKTYTADEANRANAELDGHITTSVIKTPAVNYTQDEVDAYNATLTGAVHAGDPKYYSLDEFKALTNSQISEDLFNLLTIAQKAKHYTYDEYKELDGNSDVTEDAFNALPELQKRKMYTFSEYKALPGKSEITEDQFNNLSVDEKTILYTYDEYKALTSTITPFSDYDQAKFGAIDREKKRNGEHTAESAKTYNASLTGAVKAGDEKSPAVTYTQEEVDAYNATLTGAVHAGDVKEYKVKTDGSSVQANPGDIKDDTVANPKIMMLITLADGTTYSLDLASCKDENGVEVKTWKRGEHYTYTIKLTKSDITFLAMVKDWVEKSTSGNATLEWD